MYNIKLKKQLVERLRKENADSYIGFKFLLSLSTIHVRRLARPLSVFASR